MEYRRRGFHGEHGGQVTTKRDYLISLGLAKAGRGKFSNEAKAALAKAIAEGMEFSDNAPAPVSPKVSDGEAKPRVAPENAEVILQTEMRYYGVRWYGKNDAGKRIEVSERAACMNCGYSLIGHICNNARALTAKGLQLAVTPSG